MPSPVYWLTVPSNRWTPSVRISKKPFRIRCHSSGSTCSASSIEPLTSANENGDLLALALEGGLALEDLVGQVLRRVGAGIAFGRWRRRFDQAIPTPVTEILSYRVLSLAARAGHLPGQRCAAFATERGVAGVLEAAGGAVHDPSSLASRCGVTGGAHLGVEAVGLAERSAGLLRIAAALGQGGAHLEQMRAGARACPSPRSRASATLDDLLDLIVQVRVAGREQDASQGEQCEVLGAPIASRHGLLESRPRVCDRLLVLSQGRVDQGLPAGDVGLPHGPPLACCESDPARSGTPRAPPPSAAPAVARLPRVNIAIERNMGTPVRSAISRLCLALGQCGRGLAAPPVVETRGRSGRGSRARAPRTRARARFPAESSRQPRRDARARPSGQKRITTA